jgi:hypothetical protein
MASNPAMPADLLEFLSEVSPKSVLIRIAENPSTARETLSKLAFHDDADVRTAVADNASTPESVFKRLASDQSADVRYRVAENPQAPVASLYALLKDDNPYVCHRARQTLSRILSDSITASTRMMVVEEIELRPDLVRQDLSARFNKQLIEELNDICGCDVISLRFSPPSKAKV